MMGNDECELLEEGERLLQEMAARACERARLRHVGGDKGALLAAVFECANAGLPLPGWAAKAFTRAYLDVTANFRHATWDDVFGRPHKKHEKLAAKIKQRELQWPVWVRVSELRKERRKGRRKDWFPHVAAEFRISAGTAKEYFYQADQIARSPEPRLAAYARRKAREVEASKKKKSS